MLNVKCFIKLFAESRGSIASGCLAFDLEMAAAAAAATALFRRCMSSGTESKPCLEHIRVARHDARCLSQIASRRWNQLQIGIGVEGSGCGGGGGKDDDVIIIEQVSSGDL